MKMQRNADEETNIRFAKKENKVRMQSHVSCDSPSK